MRYNEDGSLDTNFAGGGIHRPNIAIGFRDRIKSAVIQADGKILAGGSTWGFSYPFPRIFLLRYLPNGSLDAGFGGEGYRIYDTHETLDAAPLEVFLQSTGKILLIGQATFQSNPDGFARRYNTDASVDGSFSPILFPFDRFTTAFVQPDDKILIASIINKTDSLDRVHQDSAISRFTVNGTVDTGFGTNGQTSFDITNYFNDQPNAFQILPDGQIIVGVDVQVAANRSNLRGFMFSYARLSPSGAVHGKFLVTKSVYGETPHISILPDGKILTTYRNIDGDIFLVRAVGVPLQTYRLRGVPFNFRLSGTDGTADASVFRQSDRKWYVNPTFPGYFFGLADDILAPSDYIGDFGTDLAVFRPSDGTWCITRDYSNAATNFFSVRWGAAGDIPQPNDFDGDGKSDLAVFRPENGVWYIRHSADNSHRIQTWGLNGDKPVSGDYDGDGIIDIAVWRPSDGVWYIVKSSDGQYIITRFGLNGDVPVQEDYDGDGKTDIAVWRPSDGVWYRLNSSDGSFFAFNWGLSTDIATPADYDGDLKTDIAVWRPSNGCWFVYQSNNNSVNILSWGLSTDIPTQGKF